MPKRFVIAVVALIALWMFAPIAHAQKAAAAPRRDLSGIWEPPSNDSGVQGRGAKAVPADGKPEHEPPYTPFGREAFLRNKPANGPTEVPEAEVNDPVHFCDPQGFPRENLFELRTTQILQTPLQVVILYEYGKIWRTIWTDGRALPKDPEP